jgi:hypothetical protein
MESGFESFHHEAPVLVSILENPMILNHVFQLAPKPNAYLATASSEAPDVMTGTSSRRGFRAMAMQWLLIPKSVLGSTFLWNTALVFLTTLQRRKAAGGFLVPHLLKRINLSKFGQWNSNNLSTPVNF